MLKKILHILFILGIIYPITLQEAYDEATSYGDYDKYIELNPDSIYYGGLGLYEGNIFINGSGAVIDLENGGGIWVYGNDNYPCNLDIKFCSIINGAYYGISFGGESTGSVSNCNLVNNDMGIKLYDYSIVTIENSNFIENYTYGLGIYTENPICSISYCNSWNNGEYDFMENCPGWGNIWTPWEPSPGTNLINENPLFLDIENYNFGYTNSSPCIDSGNPNIFDSDGTVSDIGAVPYNNFVNGDCNQDNEQNIIDVVYNLNNCIIEIIIDTCECSDLNGDDEYNILDIVALVNIILSN